LIEKKDPEIEAEYLLLNDWADLLKDDRVEFKDDDLLVLLSTRKGTVSWEPNLERLPRIIAQNFPKVNSITVYPSEQQQEEITTHSIRFERSSIIPHISTEHVNFELNDVSAHEALKSMMYKKFRDNPIELKRLTEELINTDTDNLPGELPCVVLTKTRSNTINEATLFMGISSSGIDYPGIKEKVNLIFVLVTPPHTTTQRNLNILANLARMLSSKKTVNKLKEAKNMKQVDEIFQAAQLKYARN